MTINPTSSFEFDYKMGSNQSVRATHFQRPREHPPASKESSEEENRISISNKMVERLVEDATLTRGTNLKLTKAKEDYKDMIYMEKLKCLDDNHSERFGITVDNMNALVNRVEVRTANMVSVEPVCADIKKKLIDCYDNATNDDVIKCWDTIGAFSQCVRDAGVRRLYERSERDARDNARRSRHVQHARHHALKDISQ
ncbi:uncharacterized protein LOC116765858 isoform X1 [Danaus plexippus]|nr:uncharacterized protein LOC116765858 isoform X1 [Danaus plexippus]